VDQLRRLAASSWFSAVDCLQLSLIQYWSAVDLCNFWSWKINIDKWGHPVYAGTLAYISHDVRCAACNVSSGFYDERTLLTVERWMWWRVSRLVECTYCGRKQHQICALHMEQIWPTEFVCAGCVAARSIRRRDNKYTAKRMSHLICLFHVVRPQHNMTVLVLLTLSVASIHRLHAVFQWLERFSLCLLIYFYAYGRLHQRRLTLSRD